MSENKSWDESIGNYTYRRLAYLANLPAINIPHRFPIKGGQAMNRYLIIERLGKTNERRKEFTASNLDVALRSDEDEEFARELRLLIKY